MSKRKEDISIKSSAGEYLSYIASTGNGDVNMEVLYFEESTVKNFLTVQNKN